MIMKPDKVLCCRFLFTFLALVFGRAQNIIFVYSVLQRILPIETCWLRNSCIVYQRKTKDFARSWTFQPKSWHLCLLHS